MEEVKIALLFNPRSSVRSRFEVQFRINRIRRWAAARHAGRVIIVINQAGLLSGRIWAIQNS
jgi:hypothetical protein